MKGPEPDWVEMAVYDGTCELQRVQTLCTVITQLLRNKSAQPTDESARFCGGTRAPPRLLSEWWQCRPHPTHRSYAHRERWCAWWCPAPSLRKSEWVSEEEGKTGRGLSQDVLAAHGESFQDGSWLKEHQVEFNLGLYCKQTLQLCPVN